MSRPLHVLVVDDSAVMREVMTLLLEGTGGFEVSAAADPIIAMEKMRKRRPDVVLLDLEMPRMDGLSFLRKLMAENPLPVVICSGHSAQGTEAALRALEEGAFEVVAKPQLGVREFVERSTQLFVDVLRAAAQCPPARRRPPSPRHDAGVILSPPRLAPRPGASEPIVAIGASTGGTEAIRALLERFPIEVPGLVIAQHMPEGFTAAFAKRLDSLCAIEVKEAEQGDWVTPGRALIAPGGRHLLIHRAGGGYQVELSSGPAVSRHRPSVDVLFRSVARAAGPNAIGMILTGMGDDGARGLLEMRQAGARTLAQDEASCVVFGMPKEAIAQGAVERVGALEELGNEVLRLRK